MKKYIQFTLLAILFISGLFAVCRAVITREVPMTQFIDIANADNGTSVLAWYDDRDIVIGQVTTGGNIKKYIRFDSVKRDEMYTIEGIGAGNHDRVFALRNTLDPYTGDLCSQDLMVIDFHGGFGKTEKLIRLTNEDENYIYHFINVSEDTITLIATDPYETMAVRRNYEYGTNLSGTLNMKNSRTYQLAEGEGIYKAVGNGQDLVYISDSGKIFHATEADGLVKEIYPARTVESLLYPTFISYAESGYVYFGEHESGDVVKLNITDGTEEAVLNGNSTLNGSSLYTSKDLLNVSMTNIGNYAAVVYNTHTETFNLVKTIDGITETVDRMHYSTVLILFKLIINWIIGIVVLFLIFGVCELFIKLVQSGSTVIGRLLAATLPMIVVALIIFGLIAFSYYKSSIQTNFEKQTEDEGNMLTALFGQESFNEIEYPYDYTSEAYSYLMSQLKTRELYSRVIYYEGGSLYIGVDENSPCFYPFGIWMNLDAEKLYKKAALTGKAVTGTIRDEMGERLVCITPVGGVSGDTVYLLETGIYTSNIDEYVKAYLGQFALICIVFIILTIVVLSISYYRILRPLNDVKNVMREFTDGNTNVRIETTSEDEIAGISRIFNNMADDMMLQIHNLQKMGDTYYHFVPVSVISLLGMDNLGDLSLGSKIVGKYPVLKAELKLPKTADDEDIESITNRFFNTINNFAGQNSIVPIVDSASLDSIMLICQKGVQSAITAALSMLARIDADNAMPENADFKINANFVLHETEINFGICGDKDRYVLALFAPEIPKLMKNGRFFDLSGSRLLVTSEAYELLENKELFASRYAGAVKVAGRSMGMYDVYDDRSAEEIRLIKHSMRIFEKAMDLYEQGIYYEAKNLFAMVLRENPRDYVAKYYIFQCEALSRQ